MPRDRFQIPDVEDASNATSPNQKEIATIAEPMRETIEPAERQRQRHEAIRGILDRRSQAPILSESEIGAARSEGRP